MLTRAFFRNSLNGGNNYGIINNWGVINGLGGIHNPGNLQQTGGTADHNGVQQLYNGAEGDGEDHGGHSSHDDDQHASNNYLQVRPQRGGIPTYDMRLGNQHNHMGHLYTTSNGFGFPSMASNYPQLAGSNNSLFQPVNDELEGPDRFLSRGMCNETGIMDRRWLPPPSHHTQATARAQRPVLQIGAIHMGAAVANSTASTSNHNNFIIQTAPSEAAQSVHYVYGHRGDHSPPAPRKLTWKSDYSVKMTAA